ncbi:MAG: hypothetical protein QOI61_2376 [Actinomycetota bacterium]|jgi:hypothetical protein
MRGQSRALRAVSVAAFAIAPLAAIDVSSAAVETGDAVADGPGVAIENTGGNVELGTGHSESRVVIGDPASAPAVTPPGALLAKTKAAPKLKPVNPAADAVAKAKALVDAARARAQAQIDEARRMAEEAQQKAHDQADEARARSDAQSSEARTRSDQSSASTSD